MPPRRSDLSEAPAPAPPTFVAHALLFGGIDHSVAAGLAANDLVCFSEAARITTMVLAWNVDVADVAKALELAKASRQAQSEQFIFLHAKGVEDTFTEAPSGAPMKAFDLILNPPNAHWEECRARLDRILCQEGDSTADEVPSNVVSFDAVMMKMPQWSPTRDNYVFHRNEGIAVVQRWQRSGLCYIHAAEVVQCYLVALHDRDAGMIDMARMIRQTFHHKELQKHIFANQGGCSKKMLKRILMPGSRVSVEGIASAGDRLREFGALLISGFAVHEDFHGSTSLSFDGAPAGKLIGHHAMTMIGHRVDDSDGKHWFLVQNWWSQMQFVEISAEYLDACDASLYFVKTAQTEIPEEFPVQHHMFAENENVDKPENVNFTEPECPPPPK